MKNLKLGFAPILAIIIVIVVLGVGGYLWYSQNGATPSVAQKPAITPSAPPGFIPPTTPPPTTDQAANWKTYRNDQYGFEFEYPPQFENVGQESANSMFGSVGEPRKGFYLGPLVVVIADTPEFRRSAMKKFNEAISYANEHLFFNDTYIGRDVNTDNNSKTEGEEEGYPTCLPLEATAAQQAVIYRIVCHGGSQTIMITKNFDILFDGYSGGYSQEATKYFGKLSDKDFKLILSTFKFTK